ncbi:hypothetical protein [Paraburkholderia sp. GAS334]|uniref:hypothetical protein n=1 Tax=Paraburkholderia sp. GAS334 TaxID=3035131 RepID=UPI003D1D9B5E
MSDLDRKDRIDKIVQKLSAMLAVTCGESGESFRNLNDTIQNNYMWARADMACELQDLMLGTSEANQEAEAAHV